MAEFSGLS